MAPWIEKKMLRAIRGYSRMWGRLPEPEKMTKTDLYKFEAIYEATSFRVLWGSSCLFFPVFFF